VENSRAVTDIVIVGSSVAAVRAAETLRQSGHEGTITVVGAEAVMPYDKPPLSKKYLSGEVDADRIMLRRPEMLEELHIDWRLGSAAVSLDTAGRTVSLADGSAEPWDGVILATGGTVRTLPTVPMTGGVHVLRSRDDADALRTELRPGTRLVVIGAGFIGLEAAATAAQLGAHVTVLEGAPAPLIRGLGAQMGAAVAAVHARNGVDVRCGVSVTGIEQRDGRVSAVTLGDGASVAADAVLVGIGVTTATQWLEGSGLTLRDGVVCDANLCAGVPGVYAAGDLLRWPNAMFAHVEPDMRVEHWTNAAEQGAIAAQNLLAWSRGEPQTPYSAVPFFWSDQFDARIQFLGRSHPDAEVTVVAGDPAEGRFAAMYVLHDRLIAVLGVTMPKMVMPSRALLSVPTTRGQALAHFERLRNPPAPAG
jgi:NADPH-dependent 2,4-dienoyl-CoA reductase/sulfur reductase-like enzyme